VDPGFGNEVITATGAGISVIIFISAGFDF
jgi:hypothetical protein